MPYFAPPDILGWRQRTVGVVSVLPNRRHRTADKRARFKSNRIQSHDLATK
jgi:hypothetical protein